MFKPLALCAVPVMFLSNALFCATAQQLDGRYIATAYAQSGVTASGEYAHRHVVAADPDVLPLGTRIKITRAGRYSGEYVVADTGSKIEGRKLDIYLSSEAACRKFGKRGVRVKVLQLGDGTQAATKQADNTVKADVSKDVQKNVVGNAATEDDWAAKNRGANKSSGTAPSPPPAGTSSTAPSQPK